MYSETPETRKLEKHLAAVNFGIKRDMNCVFCFKNSDFF
jgi:hypothetical protein